MVEWTNSLDPLVEQIHITWTAEGILKEVFLDKTATSYNITGLIDANYEVVVSAVDKDGNSSLPSNAYGRPYTSAHETIRSYTRGIIKHFMVDNNLVFFYDNWFDNVQSIVLKYTDTSGQAQTFEMTKEVLATKYGLLENVDTSKEIAILRTGKVLGCDDMIVFDPYILSKDRLFTTDFKMLLRYRLSTA